MTDVHAVHALLSRHRLSLRPEKAMQADIGTVLTQAGIIHSREFHLSADDIPDFWIPAAGLVIECKAQPKDKMAIWRQIERYTAHEIVNDLILITGRTMGLPETSNDKGLYYIAAGKAWL